MVSKKLDTLQKLTRTMPSGKQRLFQRPENQIIQLLHMRIQRRHFFWPGEEEIKLQKIINFF